MKYRTLNQGLTTTPGTPCPTLFDNCVGPLTSPANHVTLHEDAGNGALSL